MSIDNQSEKEEFVNEGILCLVTESEEELTDAELKKNHHALEHNYAEKLTNLIVNAKRTADKAGTENRLRKIKAECQGCSRNPNSK